MIEKVSNKWLDDVIVLHELGGIGSDLEHAAFCELRDRRAAEREQAAPSETSGTTCAPRVELRDGPVKRSSAEAAEYVLRKRADTWKKLAAIDAGEQAALEPDTWPLGWTFVQDGGWVSVVNSQNVTLATFAIQQEAATEPPKPAKWERRLAKMAGSLLHNAESGEWEVWWEQVGGEGLDRVDFGKTPQEAVEAAWRAWKEARGE